MLSLSYNCCTLAAFVSFASKRDSLCRRLEKLRKLPGASYGFGKNDVSVNYSQISFFIFHVPAAAGAFPNRKRRFSSQGRLICNFFNLRHKWRVHNHLIGTISGIVGHLSARVQLPTLAVTAAHSPNGWTPSYRRGALRNNQPNPLLCYVLQPFSLHSFSRSLRRPRKPLRSLEASFRTLPSMQGR